MINNLGVAWRGVGRRRIGVLETEVEVELPGVVVVVVVAASAVGGAGAGGGERGGGAGRRGGGDGGRGGGAVGASPPVKHVIAAGAAGLLGRLVRGVARAGCQHGHAAGLGRPRPRACPCPCPCPRSRRHRRCLVGRVVVVVQAAGAVRGDGERRRHRHGGGVHVSRVRRRGEEAAQDPRGGARDAVVGGGGVGGRGCGARRRRIGLLRVRGHVEVGVPADAPLLLVRVLVAPQRLRLEELLVAEEAGEQAHVLAVHARRRHAASAPGSRRRRRGRCWRRRRRQGQRQVGRRLRPGVVVHVRISVGGGNETPGLRLGGGCSVARRHGRAGVRVES
jgi:hypothetical protein